MATPLVHYDFALTLPEAELLLRQLLQNNAADCYNEWPQDVQDMYNRLIEFLRPRHYDRG